MARRRKRLQGTPEEHRGSARRHAKALRVDLRHAAKALAGTPDIAACKLALTRIVDAASRQGMYGIDREWAPQKSLRSGPRGARALSKLEVVFFKKCLR
jgi:hypothetical protein